MDLTEQDSQKKISYILRELAFALTYHNQYAEAVEISMLKTDFTRLADEKRRYSYEVAIEFRGEKISSGQLR